MLQEQTRWVQGRQKGVWPRLNYVCFLESEVINMHTAVSVCGSGFVGSRARIWNWSVGYSEVQWFKAFVTSPELCVAYTPTNKQPPKPPNMAYMLLLLGSSVSRFQELGVVSSTRGESDICHSLCLIVDWYGWWRNLAQFKIPSIFMEYLRTTFYILPRPN